MFSKSQEVPRCMLAIAGKEYKDVRATGTDDKGDSLDANLGRLPLLETTAGGKIGQSAAINFFVATECGMLGSSSLEAAQILAFIEHIKELSAAYRTASPWGTEPVPEKMAEFFDDASATDYTGPAARGGKRAFLWFLGRMELLVGADGFAVGGKLSLADVMLYGLLGDTLDATLHEDMPAWKREPLTDKAKVDAALVKHPKIAACVASVAQHPAIIAWMAKRGKQAF